MSDFKIIDQFCIIHHKLKKKSTPNNDTIFKEYTFGEMYLSNIESEIQESFNINNPTFLINFKPITEKATLIEWIDYRLDEKRIIKYKHLGEAFFELKDFSPNPPETICLNIVNNYLKQLREYSTERYGKEPFFKINGAILNENEARSQLVSTISNGSAGLDTEHELIPDPSGQNRIIYQPWFYEREAGVDLQDGYITLENTYSQES